MTLGLHHFTDRVGEGSGQPRLDAEDGEELMHVQPRVAVALGNRAPEASGTLYITTKKVVWLSDADKEKGYAVDFLSVSLHAVSRDLEAYPSPCIYTQIETGADDDESEGSDMEGDGSLELSKVTEMRLLPSDPSQLDVLFDVFCECAELNPDPGADQDEENEWIYGDDQMVVEGDSQWNLSEELTNPIGYTNGDLADTVLELQINDDERFEDAKESETETHGDGGHQ